MAKYKFYIYAVYEEEIEVEEALTDEDLEIHFDIVKDCYMENPMAFITKSGFERIES